MELHGVITHQWQEDLLFIECNGPFNAESLIYYGGQIQSSVKDSGLKHWRKLEVWDEHSLAGPEGFEACKKFLDWCTSNGCDYTAIVVSNRLQFRILQGELNDKFQIFNDVESAQAWLETLDAK